MTTEKRWTEADAKAAIAQVLKSRGGPLKAELIKITEEIARIAAESGQVRIGARGLEMLGQIVDHGLGRARPR